MQIIENQSLKGYNTFAIDVRARYFCRISSQEELLELFASEVFKTQPKLILGGGSNILLTKHIPGLVVVIGLLGKTVEKEMVGSSLVSVAAGENWHEFVLYTIDKNLGGLENLSFIPGCVGAAPMQNIGAYGVEAKKSIEYVEAIEIASGETRRFTNAECKFGYRDSIFKRELKDKYIITKVGFRLDKYPHKLVTTYGPVEAELGKLNKPKDQWTIRDVSEAVTNIRKTKLPDPKEIGTAGSFFKNPFVSQEKFAELKAAHPDIPNYEEQAGIKIPAGWLIEHAGWKGFREGDAGVHKDHALVLVNYENASGSEVWQLAQDIQTDVEKKYGIKLEPEVNII